MTPAALVVITGTSGGLGGALAKAVCSAGYRVVGVSRRNVSASDLDVPDASYRHLRYDLEDVDGIPNLASTITRDHGTPYGLVNNAALGLDGLLLTMHNTQIQRLLQVNVMSPILLTKYLSRPMLDAREGRIINITSVVARTGYRGLAAYAATKGAMESFTRSFARDVGSRGITVNCIAPGFMATDMTASLGDDALARITRRAALGRAPMADEVAACAEYLLSKPAAGITGTTITVDAGNSA